MNSSSSNQSNQSNQERIIKIFTSVRCLNRDQLPRYLQGQMTDVEQHLIEQHLVDCDLCHDALNALREQSLEQYDRLSQELQRYVLDEFKPVEKQVKKQVSRAERRNMVREKLLSSFWVVFFIVFIVGGIFALQQHLKNRPAPVLQVFNSPPRNEPDTPAGRTDTSYRTATVTPAVIKDTIRQQAVAAVKKDTARVLRKDTAGMAPPKDTLRKKDSAVRKPPPPVTDTGVRTSIQPSVQPQRQPEKEEKKPAEEKTPVSSPVEKAVTPVLNPDDALFRFAMQKQQQGDINEAISQYKRLSGSAKFSERAKYQLALCYEAKGQAAKARRLLKELIKQDGSMKSQAQSALNRLH